MDDVEDAIYEYCAGYAKHPHYGSLLVMVGENGCGKSHIAKSIRHWHREVSQKFPLVMGDESYRIPDCFYSNWSRICDGFKQGNFDIVEDMIESTMCIIDDIGSEHDPSRCGVNKLCSILDRRERKFTIVTTNILSGAWMAKFDRRVASRLFRNSLVLDMTGIPDFCATR